MVTYTCNRGAEEDEAGGTWILCYPGQIREKKKDKIKIGSYGVLTFNFLSICFIYVCEQHVHVYLLWLCVWAGLFMFKHLF